MNTPASPMKSGADADQDRDHEKKKVKISVDNHPRHVPPGMYPVSTFKSMVDVPQDKELEQVIDGILTPVDDNGTVTIRGGEVFFSHVRRGGAS